MVDTLPKKLAAIADECSYVQKTGRNDFHKYRYATAADVLAKVNEAMAKHGVCSTVEPEVLSETDNAGNRTVTVKVRLTLHDGDSDQTLSTAGIGCGQDKGDKAVMKAQTAAIKYAWMLALNISTGDDPEADEETDKHAAKPRTETPRPAAGAGQPVARGAVAPRVAPSQPPADPDDTEAAFNNLPSASAPQTAAPTWANTPLGRQVSALVDALNAMNAKFALPADDATEADLQGWIASKRGLLKARGG